MPLEIVTVEGVLGSKNYSHATRIGDVLFISGQVAQDREGNVIGRGDVRAQAAQVFANLRAVLESAGSGLDQIAKITIFTTSLDHRPAIAEARSMAFEGISHLPASTFVVISSLASPDYLVEIEAIAAAH